MNVLLAVSRLLNALWRPLGRRGFLRRTAPILFGLIVSVGSAIPPATGQAPLPIVPAIPVAFAGYPCSSHSGEWPTFTGNLANSSGTMLSESTTGDVYGRITRVDTRWQPSPGCGSYRYDAIIWATDNSGTTCGSIGAPCRATGCTATTSSGPPTTCMPTAARARPRLPRGSWRR